MVPTHIAKLTGDASRRKVRRTASGVPAMSCRLSTALAAAILCFGQIAALPVAASNKLLNGEYAETGTTTCLSAQGGFNSMLQPNVPANAIVNTWSLDGVWTFNGAGSISETSTNTLTSFPGSSSSGLVPSVNLTTTSGSRKYVVGATDGVTVTITKGKWTIVAAPRLGQTFVVDKIVLNGQASSDGRTVTLGTTTSAVETTTFSNGDVNTAICHRSIVLLKH
jgi:hypothetical protein